MSNPITVSGYISSNYIFCVEWGIIFEVWMIFLRSDFSWILLLGFLQWIILKAYFLYENFKSCTVLRGKRSSYVLPKIYTLHRCWNSASVAAVYRIQEFKFCLTVRNQSFWNLDVTDNSFDITFPVTSGNLLLDQHAHWSTTLKVYHIMSTNWHE